MTASQERANDRARESTFQAWQTARFYLQGRSKKGLPKFSDAIREIGGTPAREKSQSPEVMKAMLHMIGLKEQRING